MSGSELHDFVQLGAEGQTAPSFISQPGALTTAGLALVTAQASTQTNTGAIGAYGINSVAQAQQVLAVTGPIYSSPGGILNKTSALTTGGGP